MKMISLKKCLTSGKSFLEDTIDILDLGGGEIPDNFGIRDEYKVETNLGEVYIPNICRERIPSKYSDAKN